MLGKLVGAEEEVAKSKLAILLSIITGLRSIWDKLKRYKFITNAGAYISSNVLLKAAGFLLTPLWARFLTPADYGITGTLGAYSGVLTTLLMMGLHGAVVRQYYDYMDDPESQKSYVTSVTLFQLLVSGVVVLLLNIWGPALWARFTTGRIPFDPYVRFMLLSACVATWIAIPQSLYQAQQKARSYVYVGYGRFFLGVAANLILVVGLRQGAYGKMLGQLVSGATVAIVVLVLVLRRWFAPHIDWRYIRDGLVYGLPLVPHLVGGWALRAADRVVLERFVSLSELGLYNFGYTLGMSMQFLVAGINRAWVPYYFRLMENHSSPNNRIVRVVSIYVALIGGICLVGVLFSGEIVYVLMPPIYQGVVPYVAPVLLGYLFMGFYYFAGLPFFYYKKTEILPLLTVSVGVVNVFLNLWLVPHYGAIVSAWLTALTYGLQFIITFWVGRFYQKIGYPLARYGFILLIILAGIMLTNLLDILNLWSMIAKSVFLVVYAALSFLVLVRPVINGRAPLSYE